MTVTIMDLLCGRESKLLTDSRPKNGPSLTDITLSIKNLDNDYHFYACTQTVSPKYKVGSRYLCRLPPDRQINCLKEILRSNFSGYVYIGVFEFTQNNVVHCHMLVAHKHIKVCNSVVRAGILDILRGLGKVQYCEKIGKMDSYIEYMFKEYDPSLNNIIYSCDFNF